MSFPPWYAEAEACSSHQGANMVKFLTLKALFLLAISSLKRIGDLQALLVATSCLEFAPGMVKAFLHPRPGYIPKVPANVARSIML